MSNFVHQPSKNPHEELSERKASFRDLENTLDMEDNYVMWLRLGLVVSTLSITMYELLRRRDMLWVIKVLLTISTAIFGIGTYNYYTRFNWLTQNNEIIDRPLHYVYMSFGAFLTAVVFSILIMFVFEHKPKSK